MDEDDAGLNDDDHPPQAGGGGRNREPGHQYRGANRHGPMRAKTEETPS